MADDTFLAADMTKDDDVQDAVVVEDEVPAAAADPEDDSRPEDYDDEMFEWEDEELKLARIFRPYTPPKQNQNVPLVITKAEIVVGQYGTQVRVEADHLSEEFGDKPWPYSVYLSKVDDRRQDKIRYPLGTAFRATKILSPDGTKGKKQAPLKELVELLPGKEFISRVYFVDKEDKKGQVEIKAFWGEFGAICNGDGEHLKQQEKGTDKGKLLYFNPLTGSNKVEGDVFADEDDNPILDADENEVKFGDKNPLLGEDTGFGAVGKPILDLDEDHHEIIFTPSRREERLSDEFIMMPDLNIVIDGEELVVDYEYAISMMTPVKANTKVVATNLMTGEKKNARYGFDSVWVEDTAIDPGTLGNVEDAGMTG